MKCSLYFCKLCFAFFTFILINKNVAAQKNSGTYSDTINSVHRFKSAGAITGFGFCLDKDTYYQPVYFAGDFSWSFKRTNQPHFWAWYFEPQFNLVHTIRPWDIEFGTNLGIRHYARINPGFYFYQMLGSGPHFITADIKRQSKGFIFSDNLAVGIYKQLSKKPLFLNLQLRLRHISNAGLKRPNGGINTFNFIVGLSKFR